MTEDNKIQSKKKIKITAIGTRMIIFGMFLFVIGKFLIDNHELGWLGLILLFIGTIPWIIIGATKLFSKLRKFQKKHNIANKTIGFRCITSCSIIGIILVFCGFIYYIEAIPILGFILFLTGLILGIIRLFHKIKKEYKIQDITIGIIFITIGIFFIFIFQHGRGFPITFIVITSIVPSIGLAHLTNGLVNLNISNEQKNKTANIGILYTIFGLILTTIWSKISPYRLGSTLLIVGGILLIAGLMLSIIGLFYKPKAKARIAIGFSTLAIIWYYFYIRY